MGLNEARVEKKLAEEVEKRGGFCLKFVSPNMNGVPDRLVLYPGGQAYFVEVKAPKERPRKLQLKVAEWFAELDHNVYIVDSQEDAVELAEGLRQNHVDAMVEKFGADRYR